MRIALVAGELSGDVLGAGLMLALREHYPEANFVGIGGPAMLRHGLQSWEPLERLAVMGLVEVLKHLPELLSIRQRLVQRLLADPPAVFIGIDAPDFNLRIERRLRRAGIPTVHYVSPSVWAWRPWRVRGIAQAADLLLTLFPFEAPFYAGHGVNVHYVGHPLADYIPLTTPHYAARQALSLSSAYPVIALLPGSRMGEVQRLAPLFLSTALWLQQRRPQLQFVMPAATPALHGCLEHMQRTRAPTLELTITAGRAQRAMAAADAVLLASGTATLEGMLLKRPLVVAYQVAPLTAWLARRLVRVPYFALPNLLAGSELVPELFQDAATPERLGNALLHWLDDEDAQGELVQQFTALHLTLRCCASRKAAAAISALCQQRQRD